jgi:hypothetical protein
VLMLSLLANGIVAADLVAGPDSGAVSQDRAALRVVTLGQGSSTLPTTSMTPTAPETSAASASGSASSPDPSPLPGGAKAAVERRLAALLISARARKLPRRFVDTTTGLIKSNVQVVCRKRAPRSFLCVVRLPSYAPKEGLYVRYRGGRKGRGVFTWYGYRPG